MGDGTLAHLGFLAVRQAVAAGTSVTFKILANGVVAMTGGQHAAGSLSIPALTRQLEAEGVHVVPTARAANLTMNREGIRRFAAEELGLPTSPYRFVATEAEKIRI